MSISFEYGYLISLKELLISSIKFHYTYILEKTVLMLTVIVPIIKDILIMEFDTKNWIIEI